MTDMTPFDSAETSGNLTDLVDFEMTWFLIAVAKDGNVVILDHSPEWTPFYIEFFWEDTFALPAPTDLAPGAYRWTGYDVGSWGEDDLLDVKGGTFIPYKLGTE